MKNMTIPLRYKAILNKIFITAKENNLDIYIVGGFVRDLFTNRAPKDLDIMVCTREERADGHLAGVNFSKILRNKYKLSEPVIFEKFGTARLLIDNEEVEFIMPRKEYYNSNSRNPDVQLASLKQDALRRDFTINALFLRLSDMKIIDLTSQGLNDIKNKIIRVTDISNPEIIFKQDPLRILRAVRQSLQLGFNIESKTYNAMKRSISCIKIISSERIRDELSKILIEKTPSKAFIMMNDIKLLIEIIPEVAKLKNLRHYADNDMFIHTLKVLDRAENNIIVRMAILLHSVDNYTTYKKNNIFFHYDHNDIKNYKKAEIILKRLKYSKELIQKISLIIQANNVYSEIHSNDYENSIVRKFVKKCGKEFNLIMDFLKANHNRGSDTYENFIKLNNKIKNLKSKNILYIKQKILSGEKLMNIFNRPSGKWIQKVKIKIEELQLKNPKLTEKDIIKEIKKTLKKY
jgi:tRNA nucleotidyltransferase/poly(A) polymerase